MLQLRWWMALIGWMLVWASGAAWAAEEAAGAEPKGGLTPGNVAAIVAKCQETAAATHSNLRDGPTKMWCAVVNREGVLLFVSATDTGGIPSDPKGSDAWRGSIEIAIAKAYTAMAFSSNQQALDSRTVGLLARLDVPQLGAPNPGTNTGPAPLFGLGATNLYRPLTGTLADDAVGLRHHGIVTFAGGQPVYDCQGGGLLGGVGVSGDEVDQDDTVAKGAVTEAGFCLQP
jgi:uncharacterized protein GlcG (DUF336 family)